ncbi:hypothetical protein GCK32_000692, partial [Trichostrongylus colubriformis]
MSRRRLVESSSSSCDHTEEPTVSEEPPRKVPKPLRRSRSLRIMAEPVRDLAQQLAELNPGENDGEEGEENDMREEGIGEPVEEESAEGIRGEVIVHQNDARISCSHLSHEQKLLYATIFKLHFGISEEMASFLDDFCQAMTDVTLPEPIGKSVKKAMYEAERRFAHRKSYYCNQCSSRLGGAKAVCENTSCPLQGVAPKRCKIMKRTTVHHLDIAPQLSLILERVLPSIISVHRQIHHDHGHGQGVERVERSETHSFPKYQRLIEMRSDFEERKINILLTINFDGVKFKKLSRSEAWPIYIRLEGLPFKEKNKFENIIMAGITFTRKPLTEQLLVEIFSRLRQELIQLRESGIPVVNENDDCTWLCTPILANGVIDFGALKTLYDLPRWQSLHGCHLCTFAGERAGYRMIWFPRFPYQGDRRTFTTSSSSSSQGMRGRTQMMDILSLNNCIPDALHVISEGITCDLFKAMFSVHSRVPVMKIRSQCLPSFHHIIATTRNYTYASKFILGIEDLPCTTGSEKDALSFVAFPLAAALNICAEPVGAVAVLAYWIVVRVLEKSAEMLVSDFEVVQDLAKSMKLLWYAIEPTLFTLKVH